jgi:hypothetical protein
MPKDAIEVVDWKPCERNTLKGFATIKVREHRLTIHDVALHKRDDKRWAQLRSKPMVQGGQLIHGSDGRIKRVPIVAFSNRETASAFSQACWQPIPRGIPKPGVTRDDLSQSVHSGAWIGRAHRLLCDQEHRGGAKPQDSPDDVKASKRDQKRHTG